MSVTTITEFLIRRFSISGHREIFKLNINLYTHRPETKRILKSEELCVISANTKKIVDISCGNIKDLSNNLIENGTLILTFEFAELDIIWNE